VMSMRIVPATTCTTARSRTSATSSAAACSRAGSTLSAGIFVSLGLREECSRRKSHCQQYRRELEWALHMRMLTPFVMRSRGKRTIEGTH
jgi:hypothetical protein